MASAKKQLSQPEPEPAAEESSSTRAALKEWIPLFTGVLGVLAGSGGSFVVLTKLAKSNGYVIESGYANFDSKSAWTASADVPGWRQSIIDVRFKKRASCRTPRIRTAISSFDLGPDGDAGVDTRVDVAVKEGTPTLEGFTLYARTWAGAERIPWVKVEWIALCDVADDP